MAIRVGDRVPEGTLVRVGAEGVDKVSAADYFAGARIALFGVPGAFTPTCHGNHLPGFLAHLAEFRAKGVDKVACLAVNDAFVLKAWAAASGAEGRIDFLADGNAAWVKALGMDRDMSAAGFGLRSGRFSMLVEDGVVKVFNEEVERGKVDLSSAERLLAAL